MGPRVPVRDHPQSHASRASRHPHLTRRPCADSPCTPAREFDAPRHVRGALLGERCVRERSCYRWRPHIPPPSGGVPLHHGWPRRRHQSVPVGDAISTPTAEVTETRLGLLSVGPRPWRALKLDRPAGTPGTHREPQRHVATCPARCDPESHDSTPSGDLRVF